MVQKGIGPRPGKLPFYEMFPSVLSTLDEEVADLAVQNGTGEIVRNHLIDVITLDQLFDLEHPLQHVDLLSIDLEGLDADVVCSCAFMRVRPQVIIVEFNDPVSKNRTLDHLTHCGYGLAAELGCNLIMKDQ